MSPNKNLLETSSPPPLEGEFFSKDESETYFRVRSFSEECSRLREYENELKDDFWVPLLFFSVLGMIWFFISCIPDL